MAYFQILPTLFWRVVLPFWFLFSSRWFFFNKAAQHETTLWISSFPESSSVLQTTAFSRPGHSPSSALNTPLPRFWPLGVINLHKCFKSIKISFPFFHKQPISLGPKYSAPFMSYAKSENSEKLTKSRKSIMEISGVWMICQWGKSV